MFVACLCLTLYLSAAARNSSDSTLLDDRLVGWQAGNDKRGAWDINSSCLSTIVACTWSVQHLNIPGCQGVRRDGKFMQTLRSVKWMVITILFPELIVIHAIIEFNMASQALRRMEQMGNPLSGPGGSKGRLCHRWGSSFHTC